MNELKPQLAEQVTCSAKGELAESDVMRALDILDKMAFFQGQRAGQELWNDKPKDVQEQDVADFLQGIEFVKNLITNALALLREKDAEIERLSHQCSECAGCTQWKCDCSNIRDEAITEFAERLKNALDDVARWSMHGDPNEYFIIGKPLIDEIAKEMKGEGNEGSDAIDRGGSVLSDRTGEKED